MKQQNIERQKQSISTPVETTPSQQLQERGIDQSEMAEQGRTLQEQSLNSPQAKKGAQLKAGAQAQADSNGPKRKPNNTGIPDRLKAVVEHFSGLSLDEARVHYNSEKPAGIGANAYAEYPNIYIAPGQEKHLAEEVWHLVQQMKGDVKANTEFEGGKQGNDASSLEGEAVREGKKMEQTTLSKEEENTPLLSASSPQPVAQRARANAPSETNRYYEETGMRLAPMTAEEYDSSEENAKVTHESGYHIFDIDNAAELDQWELNANVLELVRRRGRGEIKKVQNTFSLPVSCIESAEHIIHYAQAGNIPDWQENQANSKDVRLSFSNDDGENEEVVNISDEEIEEHHLRGGDYNFDTGGLEVGEGILVIKANEPTSSVHAVAVVGKNDTTGQIIVLERNAGATTGESNYTDANWTLNIYASATAFKNSMPNGDEYIMGKLAIPVVDSGSDDDNVAMDLGE